MNKLPVVAIVGRMNVGKSTLFNRIIKKERSIAYDYEGVTRDVIDEIVDWNDHKFSLVDSGGIAVKKQKDPLHEAVRQKSLELLQKADVVVFVVDGSLGLTQEEFALARVVHGLNKPTIVVANKSDKSSSRDVEFEFQQLGFADHCAVSAIHGAGISSLLDWIVSKLPESTEVVERPQFRVSIIGKPNVGKSSLMNLLSQQERSIVSPIEGTTREAVWQPINFDDKTVTLIDTAGVRRQSSVNEELEELMVKSSLQAVRASHIVLLMIDASQGSIADQELKLAFYAFERLARALVILFNKSDAADDYAIDRLNYNKEEYEFFLKKVQTLTISCKSGKNIHKIMPLLQQVWERYTLEIDKDTLTETIKQALLDRPLFKNTQQLKVFSAAQVRRSPMTIELEVNNHRWFEPNHLAYFENVLRSKFELRSTPIFFTLKSRV